MEKGKLTAYATYRISVWSHKTFHLLEVCLPLLGFENALNVASRNNFKFNEIKYQNNEDFQYIKGSFRYYLQISLEN